MLVTMGLWIATTGIVAVSLESFGAALVLFGIAAGWSRRIASQSTDGCRAADPKNEPPLGA